MKRRDVAYWPKASVRCVATIRPELGVKQTCRDHSNDAIDPSATLAGLTQRPTASALLALPTVLG